MRPPPPWLRALVSCLGVLPLLAADGCRAEEERAPAAAVRFDAQRAFATLQAVVAFGQRPAGSEALENLRRYLATELERAGLQPEREAFRAATPLGEVEFANLYADLEPATAPGRPVPPLVILAAHIDTKRFDVPGAPPAGKFVGANDGGSGTAVLLELARVLAATGPHAHAYRFLFLDGEESMRWDWQDPDNTYGSRHHAARLVASGEKARVRAVVVIDMVGDAGLKLAQEQNSDQALLAHFFAAAVELGLEKHVNGPRQAISDDHLRFQEIGLRAVDLIDFSYGPANRHWHTGGDVLENCAPESLDAIGRIVLRGLERLR